MQETYKQFIDSILSSRGRFACGDEYHERHHIVPKCLGGTNDEDNLIDIFAREQFEAHRLLALENPDNAKLTYSWWMMSNMNTSNQRDYEIAAKEYEEAKKAFSIVLKERDFFSGAMKYGVTDSAIHYKAAKHFSNYFDLLVWHIL